MPKAERLCGACDTPVRDTVLCTSCVNKTRHHLKDLPDHDRELEVAMTRQTRMTAPNDGGRAFDRELPFAVDAAEVHHSLRALLVAWCRLLEEEAKVPVPGNTVPSMSGHLLAHWPILRRHEAVGEFATELREVVAKVRAVIDYPDVRVVPVGYPCPEEVNGVPCRGPLVAQFPQEPRVVSMTCRKCGVVFLASQWRHVGEVILKKAAAEKAASVKDTAA